MYAELKKIFVLNEILQCSFSFMIKVHDSSIDVAASRELQSQVQIPYRQVVFVFKVYNLPYPEVATINFFGELFSLLFMTVSTVALNLLFGKINVYVSLVTTSKN